MLLAHYLSMCDISRFSSENSVDFSNRSPLKSELSDESDTNEKLTQISKKKKKEKKKKRKHQHHKKTKRRHEQSSSSGSGSDTEAGKDRASRSIRDSQESEKARWVDACRSSGVLHVVVLS